MSRNRGYYSCMPGISLLPHLLKMLFVLPYRIAAYTLNSLQEIQKKLTGQCHKFTKLKEI
jgi:hypothetical protein